MDGRQSVSFLQERGLACRGAVDALLLLGVHLRPRRMVAVHDDRPLPGRGRLVLLATVVLVV